MPTIINFVILVALFIVLGLSADLAVKNIRYIASSLKMKLFALGIILGIATTMPELSIGISSSLRGMGGLAVGNILGGIAVIVGLILSVNLILHKNIATTESWSATIPALVVISSPFLLGFDAKFGLFDGLIMMVLYLGLVFYLYKMGQREKGESLALIDKKKIAKAILMALVGIILVIITSNLAIETASIILEKFGISRLMMGILVFSIGTNLPEITIALSSYRRKASELSLSYLLSSAFTNILVLGILAVLKPISFKMDLAYLILAGSVSLIMILFVIFSYTKKSLSRLEGFIILAVYLVFLGANIYFIAQ